ncbi:diflavin oxidoreductase, partial [Dokdonella sp.]|uniref:diflavin oxidoreductase n=1 Tax=Dokdonella sp. TaxID=2291710 RepID=UPI003C5754DE
MSARFSTPPPIPLAEDKGRLLARLVDGLDSQALWWLSGYSAGLAGNQANDQPETSAPVPARSATTATILYGSQTGNAKRAAEQLAADIEAIGASVRLVSSDRYSPRNLASERLLYLVISTQGDGDPPDDARGFFDFLTSKRAPALPELCFAVLGLGDSSYPQFNAAARQIDSRLAELGASRLFPLGEADVDIETVAKPWSRQAFEHATESASAPSTNTSVLPLRRITGISGAPRHDRNTPFAAQLLSNQRITARESDREIHHIELSLEGSGLEYEPGDSLGVWPRNATALIDEVLDVLDLDGESLATHDGESLTLREWLESRRELTRLARPFVARHAAASEQADLNRLLAPEHSERLKELLASHQIIDFLRAYPARWEAEDLVATLRPLTPRLYSIASSRKVVGDEAHLTVARTAWESFGRSHAGAASGFLAEAGDDMRIPVFVERNDRFRLPSDDARDVIMIGPGTGVAPFRGFVQERAATAARGRNWLVFGNPRFRSDFLYQIEWQEALREGRLDRLDLAFSRDQAEKVYVQHRLREHGRELYV